MGAGSLLGNLWWGIQHGELPQHHAPHVAVVLIGTNDVGAVEVCTREERDILAAVPGANSRSALGLRQRCWFLRAIGCPQLFCPLSTSHDYTRGLNYI